MPKALRCVAFACLLGVALVVTVPAVTGAAVVVEPKASPYVVTPVAGGKLAPIEIKVSGFKSGQNVYVEQCDGLEITDPHWNPAIDCDTGTSPAAVFVPPSGIAVFGSNDPNHRFTPVRGQSPQGNFACFVTESAVGVPHFDRCKVRISTNNAQPTKDQVFFEIALTAPKSSSSSSSTTALVVVGAALVVIAGGIIVVRGRRTSRRSRR
jgi:hypothetical protein